MATAPGSAGKEACHQVSNTFLSAASRHERLWLTVLNRPLPRVIEFLWPIAHYRVCADGGANHIRDTLPSNNVAPDAIVGDLDSIRADVRQAYTKVGVPLVDLSSDQDSTDLEKCVDHIRHRMATNPLSEGSRDTIVVLGALGGRLDHTLGNLNTLYKNPDLPLVLIGEGNIVRLLPTGNSIITMNPEAEGIQCGVIPLGSPSMVTSRGLKYDMDGLELKFTGMISCSNQVASKEVDIQVSAPCLWISTERDVA